MDVLKRLKSTNVGFGLIILGAILMAADIYLQTPGNILIAIGGSLLSSGIVLLFSVWFIESKAENTLDNWGLTKIYKKRSEKSDDSDPRLKKARNKLDVVAFGLTSFRETHGKDIETLLNKGVNVRILTMDPDCENVFLKQREKEEGKQEGDIRNSINQLVEWANKLNKKSRKGTIKIKGYRCMTLDFYWRVDDEIYMGPYWYKFSSQNTITYKFVSGKQGFDMYADYFEQLWDDEENNKVLTRPVRSR